MCNERVLPGNEGGQRWTQVGQLGADSPEDPQQLRTAAPQERGDDLRDGVHERVEVERPEGVVATDVGDVTLGARLASRGRCHNTYVHSVGYFLQGRKFSKFSHFSGILWRKFHGLLVQILPNFRGENQAP